MRLVTFNVQRGKPNQSAASGEGKAEVLKQTVQEVALIKPDILALQEVYQGKRAEQTRGFATAMDGACVRFARARRKPGRFIARLLGRENRGYGIALVSRYPVEDSQVFTLPNRLIWRSLKGIFWFPEARIALLAVVRTPDPLVVAVTHLATRRPNTFVQLKHLEDVMKEYAKERGYDNVPLLLLGDLNMRMDAVEEYSRMDVVARAHSYPDAYPWMQIDHVLSQGVGALGQTSSVQMPMSDHRLLWVDSYVVSDVITEL